MKLKITRAIIDAIHQGTLKDLPTASDPIFGFEIPQACPNVPSEILTPKNTWPDQAAYLETAKKLATLFRNNFQQYESLCTPEVRAAGPKVN